MQIMMPRAVNTLHAKYLCTDVSMSLLSNCLYTHSLCMFTKCTCLFIPRGFSQPVKSTSLIGIHVGMGSFLMKVPRTEATFWFETRVLNHWRHAGLSEGQTPVSVALLRTFHVALRRTLAVACLRTLVWVTWALVAMTTGRGKCQILPTHSFAEKLKSDWPNVDIWKLRFPF